MHHFQPSRAALRSSLVPRAPGLDSTRALLREGYRFGLHRFDLLACDAFETRLGLRRVVVARGADAAAMFYHPGRFTRKGALPPTALMLLQDFGSVQRLDGARHHHRKSLFLHLLDRHAIGRLTMVFREEWDRRAAAWERQVETVLHPEVEHVLCRSVCRWAGVPLDERDVDRRTGELAAMIDGAGAHGPRFVRGWWRRRSTERWIRGRLAGLRRHSGHADTPAAMIAAWRDPDGALLDLRTAAVELINLLRPTVAVAYWVTFAALALHEHPALRERLQAGEQHLPWRFVQEVRRFFPFLPLVGGRALEPFDWHGRHFGRDELVMLDLYATDHDPRLWPGPGRFDPDRFQRWNGGLYDLVPQGAGDVARGHRCPGEDPAIALLTAAVDALVNGLRYTVPAQDLEIPLTRVPTLPRSRFVMRDVRRTR